MASYLDKNGVLYLWTKIKNLFVQKRAGYDLSSNDFTAEEKKKLTGIAENANNYVHPTKSAAEPAFRLIGNDTNGHVIAGSAVTKEDIVNLGIPSENTTYSAATSGADGLMSATDKAKLDAFGQASDYAKKSDITAAYRYKGSVDTAEELPKEDAAVGDVYDVKSDGMNYAWDGSQWDALGGTLEITAITNEEIDSMLAAE